MLLANAALVLLEIALTPSGLFQVQASMFGRQIATTFFDVLIGISLLARSKRFLSWAIVRAVLGLVIIIIVAVSGNLVLLMMQAAALCGALLMLLIGDASKWRIAVGSAFFGLYALAGVLSISATATGRNPLAVWAQRAQGDIGREPAGVVMGASCKYRLHAPSDQWYLRNPVAARRDNPLADQWLTRPDLDAHIVVVSEYAPNAVIHVSDYADAVANNLKLNLGGTLVSREPLDENPVFGRILHAKAKVSGLPMEYYFGLFARKDRAFQVIAFTHQDNFPELSDEFRRAIATFELPAEEEE